MEPWWDNPVTVQTKRHTSTATAHKQGSRQLTDRWRHMNTGTCPSVCQQLHSQMHTKKPLLWFRLSIHRSSEDSSTSYLYCKANQDVKKEKRSLFFWRVPQPFYVSLLMWHTVFSVLSGMLIAFYSVRVANNAVLWIFQHLAYYKQVIELLWTQLFKSVSLTYLILLSHLMCLTV